MDCNLENAVALCVRCEAIAPRFGFHTALTGGCLYKTGTRKDMDIVFYVRGESPVLDKEGLLKALADEVGFKVGTDFGYVVKTLYDGSIVDLLFPHIESEEGYPESPITTF